MQASHAEFTYITHRDLKLWLAVLNLKPLFKVLFLIDLFSTQWIDVCLLYHQDFSASWTLSTLSARDENKNKPIPFIFSPIFPVLFDTITVNSLFYARIRCFVYQIVRATKFLL